MNKTTTQYKPSDIETKLNELLPDALFDSKDWKGSDIVNKVEWLLIMYENAKSTRDTYLDQLIAKDFTLQ